MSVFTWFPELWAQKSNFYFKSLTCKKYKNVYQQSPHWRIDVELLDFFAEQIRWFFVVAKRCKESRTIRSLSTLKAFSLKCLQKQVVCGCDSETLLWNDSERKLDSEGSVSVARVRKLRYGKSSLARFCATVWERVSDVRIFSGLM